MTSASSLDRLRRMTAASDWLSLKARVTEAFADLRKRGIYARGPVGFDQSEALEEVAKQGKFRAYAFFHSQDATRARRGGPLWIGFGCTAKRPPVADTVAVGRDIVKALEQYRVFVEWDGRPKTRLAAYLSPKAAEKAKEREATESAEHTAAMEKLQADRADPRTFFADLREVLEGLSRRGPYLVLFGQEPDARTRREQAAKGKKTVVACPSSFLPTWDKLTIDVTSYPEEFDKGVVKQIAEALKKAGFEVAYVHGSYLHVRTTR